MLSKIKLYGELASFCGNRNEYEAVINRPVDAINFLKVSGRPLDEIKLVEKYSKAQGLWEDYKKNKRIYRSNKGFGK